MEKEIKNMFLWRWERFDIEFARYIATKENESAKNQIEKFLFDRTYTIKSTSKSYRHINHWEGQWIIDNNRDKGSWWRKFNLSELIWIKTIDKFRSFDISIQNIKQIKEYLFENPILWEYYCMSAIYEKKEIKILIYPNWEAYTWTVEEINLHDSFRFYEDRTQISLTWITEEVIWKKIDRNVSTQMILTPQESALFSKIYEMWDWNFEWKIQWWKIERFSTTGKKKSIKIDNELNIRKLIEKYPFHKITIHTDKLWKINDILVENKGV
jgi:hypothetical protein